MLEPYYDDYAPRITLSKPVVVLSSPSWKAAAVGNLAAQLTGLPIVELDRWIEHTQSASLMRIVAEHGAGVLQTSAVELLPRALNQKPAGWIVPGDTALLSDEVLALLAKKATLVWLSRSAAEVLESARVLVDHAPEQAWWTGGRAPESLAEIEMLLEANRRAGRHAHLTLHEQGRSTLALVQELRDRASALT